MRVIFRLPTTKLKVLDPVVMMLIEYQRKGTNILIDTGSMDPELTS
jgi:hypothetical protein